MNRIKQGSFLLLLFFVLQGCAVTNIPLKEVVYKTDEIPTVTWETVVVVYFADERGIDSIGLTDDGAEIKPKGDVVMWATKNLASVIQRAGYRVSIASTLEQAKNAKPKYIITGTIDSVYLKIASLSSTASIKIRIKTTKNNGTEKVDVLTASRTAMNNPFGDTEAEVLLETLLQAYSSVPVLLQ